MDVLSSTSRTEVQRDFDFGRLVERVDHVLGKRSVIQLHGEPVFDEGIDECNPGHLSRRPRDAALGEAFGERGDVRFAISCGELDFSDSRLSGAKLLRNCDGTVHVATIAPDDGAVQESTDFQFDLTERVRSGVQATIQTILDEELERLVGAGPYERSDQRVDVRNGGYERHVVTTGGEVAVRDVLLDSGT